MLRITIQPFSVSGFARRSIDVGTQKQYTVIKEEYGSMGKSNNEAVADYHSKLTNLRIRFPSPEVCGIDYQKMMRDRAKELGFVIQKGKDKGEGSVNAYILHLVEQDLDIAMVKGMNDLFKE